MSIQRSFSRYALSLKVGLLGTIVAMIAMLIDHTGSNSVAAQAERVYAPHGVDPNAGLIWSILYVVFVFTAASFAIGLVGALRERPWSRWWGSATAILSGIGLAVLSAASEYNSPLLPQAWRIVSGGLAALCLVILVVAWLPSGKRAMR